MQDDYELEDELEDEWGQDGSLEVDLSGDLSFSHAKQKIHLSRDGILRFEGCFLPNSFWSVRRVPSHSCSIEDVKAVYHATHRDFEHGNHTFEVRIVTCDGKAVIHLNTEDALDDPVLIEICSRLEMSCETQKRSFTEHPHFVPYTGYILAVVILTALAIWVL